MSYDSVRIALYSHLQDNLTTTSIRYDTIKEDDPITNIGNLWIKCHIEPLTTMQSSLGMSNPLDRTIGAFIIEIYDTENNGIADILRMADTIKKLYMGKSFNNGTVTINNVKLLNKEQHNGWNCRILYCNYIENIRRE